MHLNYESKVTVSAVLRDLITSLFPGRTLPAFLIRLFYGDSPNFVFLVHPRYRQDMYNASPLLRFCKRFVSEKTLFKLITFCPLYMVAKVKTERNLKGLILGSPVMPEDLLLRRNDTIGELTRITNFIRKLSAERIYVGLAAWWPIVTDSGLDFKKVLKEGDNIVVTNGHAATVLSIYMMLKKISMIGNIEFNKLKVLIIGTGRMGSGVAQVLNGSIEEIGIVDKNEPRVKALEQKLLTKETHSNIKSYAVSETSFSDEMVSEISKYHVTICTTSNVYHIIRNSNLLKNCIIIDDSRPEAFPRLVNLKKNLIVLEGGLMKIKGTFLDADFGFGKTDNVFGCMAEAMLLALDNAETLKPTLGEVDYDNFWKMSKFCDANKISVGDFISGHQHITDQMLRDCIAHKRGQA